MSTNKKQSSIQWTKQRSFIKPSTAFSTQSCNCLLCGFSKGKEGLCSDGAAHKHQPACTECAQAFSVVSKLSAAFVSKKAEARTASNDNSVWLLQQLKEYDYDIKMTKRDLVEYGSHLARHKAKGGFDLSKTASLDDDTAIVVSDWKMKILSCFC